jgi:RHH-type transcriptional regulator, rel operon repressor / antitoxin RelB
MRKASLLSVRVSQDMAERLEKLAKATEHSKSFLAAQAIEEFITLQEWQVEAIKEGIAAVVQTGMASSTQLFYPRNPSEAPSRFPGTRRKNGQVSRRYLR